jgi:hypothetical protein
MRLESQTDHDLLPDSFSPLRDRNIPFNNTSHSILVLPDQLVAYQF